MPFCFCRAGRVLVVEAAGDVDTPALQEDETVRGVRNDLDHDAPVARSDRLVPVGGVRAEVVLDAGLGLAQNVRARAD